MKKLVITATLLCHFSIHCQVADTNPQPKHEIKLNAFNLLFLEFLDGSYEYLINEESSVGGTLLVNFNDDELLKEYRMFSLTGYYRKFFGKKYAKGFFVEGFAMYNQFEDYLENYDPITETYSNGTDTAIALGISIGGKFVTKSGFTAEIFGGLGRNLLGETDSLEAVGRGGISIGYRF